MKSISRKGAAGKGGCALYGFFGIFFLAGSAVFIFFSGVPLWKWAGAQTWEETACRITSSAVRTHDSSDGATYSVDIAYTYSWNGTNYYGNNYNFMTGSSSGRAWKQAVVDRYPPQSERVCYVNPDNPEDAVLSRAFSLDYLIGTFGLLFVGVALLVLFMARRAKGNKSISRRGKIHTMEKHEVIQRGETISLKGASNNLFGCGFLLFFGVIWNGIVFTIMWSMVREDNLGSGNLFPLLFMIPFVLVGLGVIVAILYVGLSLFNPKPDLTLTPGYLPLGGTAMVGWSFRGSPNRIRHLKISLTGEEKATYQRGTNSVTDSSTFLETVLFETDVPGDMPFGEVPVTVPEFTAPSFEASNNKIVWSIKVHGDIRRWPDVKQDFPLTVSPLPPAAGIVRQPAEFWED